MNHGKKRNVKIKDKKSSVKSLAKAAEDSMPSPTDILRYAAGPVRNTELELKSNPNDEVIKYLEEHILPNAQNASFTGMVALTENGKPGVRNINSLKELEDLITELKSNSAQVVKFKAPTAKPSEEVFESKPQDKPKNKKSFWSRIFGE
jgi:hypothetical protein